MLPPPYFNDDKNSFGYESSRKRWPVIITKGLDDVHRTLMEDDGSNSVKVAEGKKIIEALGDLKYAIEHNHEMQPLPETGASDIALYNEELAKLEKKRWLEASWLYSECHLYRYIHVQFETTKFWKSYDLFARQKDATFEGSGVAVVELAIRYGQLADQLKNISDDSLNVLFHEFIDISLWGNATDLSLLTNVSIEDIRSLQGAESRKKNEANILVNDIDRAYKVLTTSETPGKRVDVVLDNAGFELYADLIMILFLLDSNLAETVVLHPKNMPWFVSDVLPVDIPKLFGFLGDANYFSSGASERLNVASKLAHYHSEGQLIIRTSPFWTTPFSFHEISPEGAGKSVYEDLVKSNLVIFKGDLNYRKLLADLQWDPTTPFKTALGALGTDEVNVLALRTAKADTIAGLPKGTYEKICTDWEKLKPGERGRQWLYSGKYAVVEYNGK